MSRYVLIPKFCAETGYSEKAVRRKIEEGVWLQNHQYRRAPDGAVHIDVAAALACRRTAPQAKPKPKAGAVVPPAPTCGVYLLMLKGVPVYVGRSTNLRQRLATHRKSGREHDEARVIPCAPEAADWLERELIRTLQPAQNLIRFARHARTMDRTIRGGLN